MFSEIIFQSTTSCTLIKLCFNRYNLNRLSNQKIFFFFFFLTYYYYYFCQCVFAVRIIIIIIIFSGHSSQKIPLFHSRTTNLVRQEKYQRDGEEGITMLPALNFGKKRPNLDSIPAKIGSANW
jgi:hypothetical protein